MLTPSSRGCKRTLKLMRRNIALYVFLIPAMAYIIIFCYWPMYGVQIAFRNYTFQNGITGSAWVGDKWFRYFFNSPLFSTLLCNTLTLSLYSLVAGFPVPIILALMIHNTPGKRYRRTIQTVTYLPHFISTVVLVGMLSCFFSVNSGFINTLIENLGGTRKQFMGMQQYFRHLYVWSGVWQGMGWNSIIYMAALTSISPELHEAAMIDGANRLQRIWHVDLPGIVPTMVILLIMRAGSIMSIGFEKVYLMQNPLNQPVSEIISTYTYKQGMLGMKYSYSSAIGLFNNVVNFVFLIIVNGVSKRLSGNSLW
ncbi:MAG: sugar ABC transporter permease [Clostridia bacterium]|nr:sugar ABC transporter permease [Clostridia bacterium]